MSVFTPLASAQSVINRSSCLQFSRSEAPFLKGAAAKHWLVLNKIFVALNNDSVITGWEPIQHILSS